MASMYESVEKELAVLAEKARLNGQWFYSKNGSWLTPEEWQSLGLTNLITHGRNDRSIITGYSTFDPKKGVKSLQRNVNKANDELERFTTKVMDYFNLKPKDDTSGFSMIVTSKPR